jgi:hypothetical protein
MEARLLDQPFFPWELPLPRVSSRTDDYQEIADRSDALIAGAKDKVGFGYEIITESRKLQLWGRNEIPTRVIFRTAEDLDAFVGRRDETKRLAQAYETIISRFPVLRDWCAHHTKQILDHDGKWEDLLTVCEYFVTTPRPGVYLREVPLPVHTKFIEDNRSVLRSLLDQLLPASELGGGGFETRFGLRVPEIFVRIRFLDEALRLRLGFPFAQAGVARADFAQLPLRGTNMLITENEVTFLTLPNLPNTLGVWGSGFAVAGLGKLPALQHARVWYWGDLDAQGFEILSLLRQRQPDTRSLLMNRETWDRFRDYVVPGQPSRSPTPMHLSEDETKLYGMVSTENLRLEQERISHGWASEHIRTALAV